MSSLDITTGPTGRIAFAATGPIPLGTMSREAFLAMISVEMNVQIFPAGARIWEVGDGLGGAVAGLIELTKQAHADSAPEEFKATADDLAWIRQASIDVAAAHRAAAQEKAPALDAHATAAAIRLLEAMREAGIGTPDEDDEPAEHPDAYALDCVTEMVTGRRVGNLGPTFITATFSALDGKTTQTAALSRGENRVLTAPFIVFRDASSAPEHVVGTIILSVI